jgi:glycine cleavage system transcriptional repressor
VAHFAVIAIGSDRPGIVAALTGALYELGGNLEDVASSILRGHFAIMLVVDAPDGLSGQALEEALGRAAQPLGVSVTVRDVEAGAASRVAATHVLVAYASDRPGIVARLTRILADRGANITDLSCRLTAEDPPVYAMVAEVALPDGTDEDVLRADLENAGRELGVDVSFRPIETETL